MDDIELKVANVSLHTPEVEDQETIPEDVHYKNFKPEIGDGEATFPKEEDVSERSQIKLVQNDPPIEHHGPDLQRLDRESVKEDSSEIQEQFMKLVLKARKLAEEGDIAAAIKLNEKALSIHFSEKLKKRIEKMKAFLEDQKEEDEEDTSGMKSLGQGFMLHSRLHQKLYRHQVQGVLWMWSLFCRGKGGILADDMGLGKTIQVIAFLAGLFDMGKVKAVMIVVPLSVLPNWLNEFKKWTPGINVMQFHGSSKKERERALAKVRSKGGVLMTTYGLVVTTKETLAERHGQEFIWDYIILDEGHKIKNATKTSKSIHHIPAKHRLILTGTPVQNNLKELWSLFDYVHQGSLLGTVRTFKMEFETPIIRARERDATVTEKKLGQEMAQTLKSIIQPFFLRRTKAEVSEEEPNFVEQSMPSMTRKNDLVIWLYLSSVQEQIYKDFVNLDQVKELLMTKKSPLVALTVLKKICDHPRLLSTRACMQLGLDGDDFNEEDLEQLETYQSAVSRIEKISDDVLIQESGKMQILVNLLDTFKSEGHKTLVFSQSRKLLDIIQKIITNRGHKFCRLDGTVTQISDRDKIVKRFQKDEACSVFLLTVQVGGVGLTLTSADRVIIYDPSWNPATDAQAVDRAYRIGQDKNVVVYRLITCGTVEEKIYRRQVFKDSITRQTTSDNKNPYRYFTKMELKELFTLDDTKFSKTQKQLESMHSNHRVTDEELDEHIAFLHSLDIFGISDHDLMFKQTKARDDEHGEDDDLEIVEDEALNQKNEDFIQYKVKTAQFLIAAESAGSIPYEERSKGVMKYPNSNLRDFKNGPHISREKQVNAASSSEAETTTEEQEDTNSGCEITDVTDMEGDDWRRSRHNESPPQLHDSLLEEEEDMEILTSNFGPGSPDRLQQAEKLDLNNSNDCLEIFPSPVSNQRQHSKTEQSLPGSPNSQVDAEMLTPDKLHESERHRNMNRLSSQLQKPSCSLTLENSLVRSSAYNSPDIFVQGTPVSPRSETNSFTRKIKSDRLVSSLQDESDQSFETTSSLNGRQKHRAHSVSDSQVSDTSSSEDEDISVAEEHGQRTNRGETHKLSPERIAGSSDGLFADDNWSSKTDSVGNQTKGANKRKSVCLRRMDSSEEECGGGSDAGVLGFDLKKRTSPLIESEIKHQSDPSSEVETHLDDSRHDSGQLKMERHSPKMEGDSKVNAESSNSGHVEETIVIEDEEEAEEKRNEHFKDLIMIARALYKKKNYSDSLQYVEEALNIYFDPDLEMMAEKIRAKIQQEH